MKIAFFCNPDSRSYFFIPPDAEGRGVGGAELSLISLTEELARLGHEVTVFNVPPEPGVYNGVNYMFAEDIDESMVWDVFVLYRSPSFTVHFVNAKKILFWSCDQQTEGDFSREVFPFVHHTVAISEYHKRYLVERYGVDPHDITAIDLGVRLSEYHGKIAKRPNSLLYCSIPARGLEHLARLFPQVRHFFPDATLTITSDFSLWGYGIPASNEEYRQLFAGMEGVRFLSKVPREQLVQLQLESDILAYPNQPHGPFAELFGVSVAECETAGCIPVTSKFGAFPTTVMNPGILLDGHPCESEYQSRFVESVIRLLSDRPELTKKQNWLRAQAMDRFNWHWIAKKWQTLFSA